MKTVSVVGLRKHPQLPELALSLERLLDEHNKSFSSDWCLSPLPGVEALGVAALAVHSPSRSYWLAAPLAPGAQNVLWNEEDSEAEALARVLLRWVVFHHATTMTKLYPLSYSPDPDLFLREVLGLPQDSERLLEWLELKEASWRYLRSLGLEEASERK